MLSAPGLKRAMVGLIMLLSTSLAACASTKSTIPFHEVAPNEPGSAVIYVYRLKSMVGAAVVWNVRLDNKIVAVLNQGAYAVVYAKPGPHTVTIGDSTVSFAGGAVGAAINSASQAGEAQAAKDGSFVAEPNGVYFIRSKGFGVDLLPREEAMKDIVEMKYDMGTDS
jgi:uncharacterized protein YigE (DUF2233 family)